MCEYEYNINILKLISWFLRQIKSLNNENLYLLLHNFFHIHLTLLSVGNSVMEKETKLYGSY